MSLLGRGIDQGKIEGGLRRLQADHQVEDLVHGPVAAGGRLVDFVDHHQQGQPGGQGLLDHEIGLGHGALLGVDQQHGAVGHAQHPFHLTAEVGMAGGIDDVDQVITELVGTVFRGDGDTALPFQVHAVHQAFGHLLVVAKHAAVMEELVHQGGFAVVDVGDNGDVTYFFAIHNLCLD